MEGSTRLFRAGQGVHKPLELFYGAIILGATMLQICNSRYSLCIIIIAIIVIILKLFLTFGDVHYCLHVHSKMVKIN